MFYRQGDKMMVVKAETAPALTLSKPQVLFEGRYEISQQVVGLRYDDVAPDGQRFEELKAKVPRSR